MKRLSFLLVLFLSAPVLGQVDNAVAPSPSTYHYLNTYLVTDLSPVSVESFDSFLQKLEKKKASIKKEKDFVRYVFSKTHQTFLKKYVHQTSFSNLFVDGSYNCLTGTILYAVLLKHFEIPVEITETNYHIFLTVETAQGKVLLETTDPWDGFVDSKSGIEKRIVSYRQQALAASNNKATYYEFNFDLFKSVSMQELEGLLYYNKSVDSFNNKKLDEAVRFLLLASERYHSPRMDEFSAVLLVAIEQSNWTEDMKKKSLRAIYPIAQKNSPAIASVTTY